MHSLGPWLYDINPKAPEAIIVDFEGCKVAHLSALENSTAASDLEDNVRLIAAAPNLLEVLKAFSDYVRDEQMATDGAVTYSTTTINHLAFLARAAIAKATGGKQ